MHALHHQGITYHTPYQQNGVVAGSQDALMAQTHHQQLQEMQSLQEHFQMAAAQQSHLYPGAYDPTSNYFPAQPQQYYLPQQSASTQHSLVDSVYQPGLSGSAPAESIQDLQAQQSSIPLGRPAARQSQPLRHESYANARPTLNASPPPMIVPSQSHVPLTAVNQATVASTALPAMETAVVSRPSPPPASRRTSAGQQAHGRTRASTVATSNLKNSSPSKIAKSKRHKKSASSVSHAALLQSTIEPQVAPPVPHSSENEIFEVSPLYAASTGVLFESMFNIKSGLLDGPSALANPEDVARVAPALGYGEGPNVLTTLSVDTVETAGGLFRSRLKERGGVVDEVSGTALVPVPAATVGTGTLHGDSHPMSGQSIMSRGDMSAMQSFDCTATSMSRPTYPHHLGSESMVAYPYEGQQVSYGRHC
jgi:hypothetical protein